MNVIGFVTGSVCLLRCASWASSAALDVVNYDAVSRLTNTIYSDGARESYSYDAAGNRLSRIILAATNYADTVAPQAPTNLTASPVSADSLVLTWSASKDTGGSGLGGYRVFMGGIMAGMPLSTSFTVSGLLPGSNYCLSVEAFDKAGNSSVRATLPCFSIPDPIDSVPPFLAIHFPTNGAVLLTNSVTVVGIATDSGRGGNGIASVNVGGTPSGGSAWLNATSAWSAVVALSPGYNRIYVTASDASPSHNGTTNEIVVIRGIGAEEPPIPLAARTSPGGFFETDLLGFPGTIYGIWASTNLADWEFLRDVVLTNWVQVVSDPEVSAHPRRFYRFSRSDQGTLVLKRSGLPIPFQPLAVDDAGRLLGSTGASLFAVDSASLTQVWQRPMPSNCGNFPADALSVSSNGIVFAVSEWNWCHDGRLTAYSAASGDFLWDAMPQSPHPRHVAALDEARSLVMHGSAPFIAFDYTLRFESWNYSGSLPIGGKGIAISSVGTVFTGWGNSSWSIVGFNPGNINVPSWAISFTAALCPEIVAVASDETLLTRQDTTLQARQTHTGTVVWSAAGLDNPITDSAGNIYCNSTVAPEVVSLSPDGTERWRTAIAGLPSVTVDFIDGENTIYARGTNVLCAVSAAGSVLWRFAADAGIQQPAVIGYGGRVILADKFGTYYQLATTSRYAPSSWPVARYGNRRHTAKAGDVRTQPGLP